ncbi:hypothetical protein [Kutzneria kofuensis]|uniref:hypothetical protein n=1 Tax=Kutzneria kofuensis TaxID=103725 RepID=UPI0031E90C40
MAARNGTSFTYAGQGDEPVSDGSETYARGPGGDLLAVRANGSNQLTLSDRHYDVVGSFNPSDTTLNALSGTTAYSPFGQVTRTPATPATSATRATGPTRAPARSTWAHAGTTRPAASSPPATACR